MQPKVFKDPMKLFDECSFPSYVDILPIETLMLMCDILKGAFKSFWQDCNYDINLIYGT